MSASHGPELQAIGRQLIAALDSHEEEVRRMLAAWPDPERHLAVSGQIEEIRMYCSALPQVRVQWVDLLIAHVELVRLLWRTQYSAEQLAAQGAAVRQLHADSVSALRSRCERLVAGGPGRPG